MQSETPTNVRTYDFERQKKMANGDYEEVLVEKIPNAVSARRSSHEENQRGTDWWVLLKSGREISVDVKIRKEDWSTKAKPEDDLALEIWSVVEKKLVGWTLDETKQTDYVFWLWLDTARTSLIPFPMLLDVFKANLNRWRVQYKTTKQRTTYDTLQYHSECIFVPRRVVWAAIYKKHSGEPTKIE